MQYYPAAAIRTHYACIDRMGVNKPKVIVTIIISNVGERTKKPVH